MSAAAPLDGIFVLDLSQGIAGPSCGGYFAEHGARVIKVEPPVGDWVRRLGTAIEGSSAQHYVFNRGKESLALDLKAPQALEIALDLAAKADVVIQGGRPGVFDRLGLGFDDIKARNGHVVYVAISGYGQSGPNRAKAMVDTIGQAISGLMDVTRGRDGRPTKIDTQLIDVFTGLYAFQAASMALFGQRRNPQARYLDISLLHSAAAMQASNIMEWAYVGSAPGLLNPPAGNYQTSDGWIAITLVTEPQFAAIAHAIGRAELAYDERFATFAVRKKNIAALRKIIDAALIAKSTDDWCVAFEQAGALASRINTYGDWLDDHHVKAIDAAPGFALPGGRIVPIPHLPGAGAFNKPAPGIGAHTRAILAEQGLTEARINDLVAASIAAATAHDA